MNIAEKIIRAKADYDAVYEAGKKASHGDGAGYDAGYEAGQKAKLRELWECIQNGGKRTNYSHYFSYWLSDDFYPIYNFNLEAEAIERTSANNAMFRKFNKNGDANFDLSARLEECGVTLDTSKCTSLMYFFYAINTSRLPRVDMRNSISCHMTYYASPVKIIDEVLVSINTKFQSNTFGYCENLEEITVRAVDEYGISTDFDIRWSNKLKKASFISIVTTLSTMKSGLTVTLPKAAVNREFGIDIDDPTTYPEGSEWYELRNSRSKWNFNFI